MISYLSKPLQDTPYILPVDLNLLAKVNQYKQTQFYKNADNLKNYYGQLKNTDLYNEQEKARFNDGYNKLQTQLSNLGAIDYSDMSITNQLEGAGAQLQDDITLKGIANTRKIRNRQQLWEKIKMDPKLAGKFYNSLNEEWDSRHDEQYRTSAAGADYYGEASPTLYAGNPYEQLTKTLKTLKPYIETSIDPITDNTMYFSKKTNTYLDNSQIIEEMQGLLDGKIMKQLTIDAWGSMRNYTPDQLEKEYNINYTKDIAGIDNLIDITKEKLLSLPNGAEKDYYTTKLSGLTAQKNETITRYDVTDFRKQLSTEEGRIGAMGNLYTRKVFESGVTAHNSKQIKRELLLNQEQVFKNRLLLEEIQQKNRIDLEKFKNNNKSNTDSASSNNGSSTTNTNTSLMSVDSDYSTTKDLKDNDALTEANIIKEASNINANISGQLSTFFIDNASGYDGKSDFLGKSRDNFLKELGRIKGLDGIDNLHMNDVRKALSADFLDETSKKYYTNIVNLFDKASIGDYNALNNTEFSKSKFIDLHKQVTIQQSAVVANLELLNKAKTEAGVLLKADYPKVFKGLSGAYKDLADDFLVNPNKYLTNVKDSIKNINGVNVLIPEHNIINNASLAEIINQDKSLMNKFYTKGTNFINDKYINKVLENNAYRKNYYKKFLSDKDYEKHGDDIKSFAKDALKLDVDFKDIHLQSIKQVSKGDKNYNNGHGAWLLTVQVQKGSGDKITHPNENIYIDDKQAQRFGVASNPYYQLDNILLYKHKTDPLFVQSTLDEKQKTTWGSDIFQYNLTRNSKDGELVVNIQDDQGKFIKLRDFYYKGQKLSFTNATQAITAFEQMSKLAATVYTTREDFFKALRQEQSN